MYEIWNTSEPIWIGKTLSMGRIWRGGVGGTPKAMLAGFDPVSLAMPGSSKTAPGGYQYDRKQRAVRSLNVELVKLVFNASPCRWFMQRAAWGGNR